MTTESGMRGAREELAEAIAVREAVRAECQKAESAVDRAQAAVADAEKQLAQFDGLDAELARHHADEIKANRASQLPSTLTKQKVAREEARESVATARTACELLKVDLDEVSAIFGGAEKAVFVAAQAVLIENAWPLAQALEEARRTAWQCADQLRGLAGLWLPPMGDDNRPRAIGLPAHLISAFTSDARPMRAISSPDPRDEETRRWSDFFQRLCRDADATFA